ncbi:hypothetical protein M885DRAFT_480309 [Pelagophyceae sp. CCMP2097]|nr:hypothetical protein M885DRAFT_480309 [Pelagophyceae sp. CCMP2097]
MHCVPPHAYGVEPAGNAYFRGDAEGMPRRGRGLGTLGLTSDAVVVEVLTYVPAAALAALAQCSTTLRAFAGLEDLWKGCCLGRAGRTKSALSYAGASWRTSFTGRAAAILDMTARRVYSDALYRPHELAHSNTFSEESNADELGPRRLCAERNVLSLEQFVDEFERPAKPVVLRGAFSNAAAEPVWDESEIVSRFGDRAFHVGGYDFALKAFLDYARSNADDQPLYLFDKNFAKTAPELAALFEPPDFFRDDLFSNLCNRPDYRWLIIGGARSGSAWHKDPNATSAWNATLRGRKRWLLLPPHATPPGVRPSLDLLEVVAPLSISEWVRGFYAECRAMPQLVEADAGPGDVVFVPRGWWHMVVNLEDYTVAVTQNFCSPAGLSATLRLLRDAPWLVSGISRPRADAADADADGVGGSKDLAGARLCEELCAALKEHRPDVLARAEEEVLKPSLWAAITQPTAPAVEPGAPLQKKAKLDDAAPQPAFAFGFSFDG